MPAFGGLALAALLTTLAILLAGNLRRLATPVHVSMVTRGRGAEAPLLVRWSSGHLAPAGLLAEVDAQGDLAHNLVRQQ